MEEKKVVIAKQDLQQIISEEVQLWKARKLLEEKRNKRMSRKHIKILEAFAELDSKFAAHLTEYKEELGG
jgi:phage pi2 protein 07